MPADVGVTRGAFTCDVRGFAIVSFLFMAIYNVIELTFIMWGYFRRHSGLYFWSFNIATYGILVFSVGFLLRGTASVKGIWAYVTLIAVGWMCMITGQSLVLWSRLHLVLRDRFKLRMILAMIIVNSIIVYVPILVFLYGANSSRPGRWTDIYAIYENVQVSVFFVQELILSSIYIYETVKLARLHAELKVAWRSRRLMIHLVVVNVIIILLDIGILGLEYARYYGTQTSYKALVYSIKLKMEFTILNRLKEMTTGNKDSTSDPHSLTDDSPWYRRRSTATGTDMGGGAFSGRCFITRPEPAVSYHAYAHGGDGWTEFDRRDNIEGSSVDNEVVLTTEIMVKRETRPEPEPEPELEPSDYHGEASNSEFITNAMEMDQVNLDVLPSLPHSSAPSIHMSSEGSKEHIQ